MGTGSSSEPPKVCLIPPLIRKRHSRPFCANEFLYFGRPTHELLNDYLGAGSYILTDMVLKPQIKQKPGARDDDRTPDVFSFLEGGINFPERLPSTWRPEDVSKNAAVKMALEARWKNNLRAVLSVKGAENLAPNVYLGAGRENIKGTSFFFSLDPRTETFQGEAGISKSGQYGSIGIRGSVLGNALPQFSAWTSVRPVAAVSLGTNIKLNPTQEGQYKPSVDLALNVRDPDAVIYDRPAYEMTFKALDLGKEFTLSYFQHIVMRRKIYNPLEENHVTHITNYVDMGAEVSVLKEKLNFGIAASWQLNKNNMFKAKLSNERAQASYVLKSWANPSFVLAFNSGFNFNHLTPQFGLAITCEASLGHQAEFERAGSNYEQVEVVRYGAEQAPPITRYDVLTDDAPVLKVQSARIEMTEQ